jgi:hypothetical protein
VRVVAVPHEVASTKSQPFTGGREDEAETQAGVETHDDAAISAGGIIREGLGRLGRRGRRSRVV